MAVTTEVPEVQLPKQETAFLDYLNTEIERLESSENRLAHLKSIRAAMTGKAPTSARADGVTRRPRKKDRLAEFVSTVRDKPGITIAEAAKQMDAAPNYLYRLKQRGLADNLIRVEGSNLFPAEEVAA